MANFVVSGSFWIISSPIQLFINVSYQSKRDMPGLSADGALHHAESAAETFHQFQPRKPD